MGQLSRLLPKHPVKIETVNAMSERDSIKDTLEICLVEGFRVTCFLVQMDNLHSLGFSEDTGQWEKIGTFPHDEIVVAFQKSIRWMQSENEFVDDPDLDLEQVESLSDLDDVLRPRGTKKMAENEL